MIAIVPLLYIRVTLSPVIIRKQLPDLIISKTKLFIMGDIYNGIDFKIVETCKNTLLGYTKTACEYGKLQKLISLECLSKESSDK